MPELPEVEHVKRGLKSVINQTILNITFSDKVIDGHHHGKQTIVKNILLDDFLKQLLNGVILEITRRSKYLIFKVKQENDIVYLISHLGMSGGYFIVDTLDDILVYNFKKHWHVQFKLSNKTLVYSDIRRFGEMRLMDAKQFKKFDKNIAPEPFDEAAKQYFLNKVSAKQYQNKAIKSVIMDHAIISGCGNIYACEALFHAGIRPDHLVKSLSKQQLVTLFESVRNVLQEGIDNGGSTISDYRNVNGESGNMQNRFVVYGKKYCMTCGESISQKVIGGRNSHYCLQCQR